MSNLGFSRKYGKVQGVRLPIRVHGANCHLYGLETYVIPAGYTGF